MSKAFIWNAAGEVLNWKQLLETQFDLTEELQGWSSTSAHLISDDGSVIVCRVAFLPIP